MGTWHAGPYWAIDTETTGVSTDDDRIVTACLVQITPGRAPVETTWLVAVDIDIPRGAQDVHGVSTEYAREHGRPAADVVGEIVSWVHTAREYGVPLVGFNLSFDLSLLAAEACRWGAPDLVVGDVLDGLVLDRYVDRYRRGKRTLTAACEQYRVKLDGAHDASFDAIAAARVVWRIATNHPEVGDKTIAELQPIQANAYREHAESLERHIRKKKREDGRPQAEIDAVRVNGEWPIKTWSEVAAA